MLARLPRSQSKDRRSNKQLTEINLAFAINSYIQLGILRVSYFLTGEVDCSFREPEHVD